MIFAICKAVAVLVSLVAASPLESRTAGDTAAAMLLAIAPTSNTCAGSHLPTECATADQAAPFLIDAMLKYSIYSPTELSAVLSLIAFESGDFKYNINHYPGRAGQGTRNMQMPQFNLEYALSIPELQAQVKAITTSSTTSGLTDDQLNAIRALVLPDQYSWGSAAWFLTTKCASARPALQASGQAGFEAYLGCVGTTVTADRLAYWKRANAAFGLA